MSHSCSQLDSPRCLQLEPHELPISGGPQPLKQSSSLRTLCPATRRGPQGRASCHLTCFYLGHPREWLWQCLRCHKHQRKMQKIKASQSLPSLRLLCRCQGVKAPTPEVHLEKLHRGELTAGALACSMEIFFIEGSDEAFCFLLLLVNLTGIKLKEFSLKC